MFFNTSPSTLSTASRYMKSTTFLFLLVAFVCVPSTSTLRMAQAQGNSLKTLNDLSPPPLSPATISFACRQCVNTVLSNIPACQNIPSSPQAGMSNTAMNALRKKCSCAWAELAFMDPTWASTDCVRPNMCSDPDIASLLDQLKPQSLAFQCPASTNGGTAVENQADCLLLGSKERHGFWKWGIITLALTLGLSTSALFSCF